MGLVQVVVSLLGLLLGGSFKLLAHDYHFLKQKHVTLLRPCKDGATGIAVAIPNKERILAIDHNITLYICTYTLHAIAMTYNYTGNILHSPML